MKVWNMQALHAVRAANNRHTWGRLPTLQYLRKRGVDIRLYQIACAVKGTQA